MHLSNYDLSVIMWRRKSLLRWEMWRRRRPKSHPQSQQGVSATMKEPREGQGRGPHRRFSRPPRACYIPLLQTLYQNLTALLIVKAGDPFGEKIVTNPETDFMFLGLQTKVLNKHHPSPSLLSSPTTWEASLLPLFFFYKHVCCLNGPNLLFV